MSFILQKTPPSFFFADLLDDPLRRGSSTRSFLPTFATPNRTLLDQVMENGIAISSNDKEFRWSLDLPGVKATDMEIEVLDDGRTLSISGVRRIFTGKGNVSTNAAAQKKQRFAHILSLNPREVDTSKIEANLSDGVLVVTAPNIPETQPVTVPVTSEPHKEVKEDIDKAHVFSIDLPGVKVEDLNIRVKDGMISIQGSRRVFGQEGKKHPFSHTIMAFRKNPKNLDATKIKANLADGVLMITAPKKEKKAIKDKPKSVTVSVTTKPHQEEEEKKGDGEPLKVVTKQNKETVETKKDKPPKVGKQ